MKVLKRGFWSLSPLRAPRLSPWSLWVAVWDLCQHSPGLSERKGSASCTSSSLLADGCCTATQRLQPVLSQTARLAEETWVCAGMQST